MNWETLCFDIKCVAPDLYQDYDMSAVFAGVLPPKPLILLFPEAFGLGVRTLSCKSVIEDWLPWKWCPHCVLISKKDDFLLEG